MALMNPELVKDFVNATMEVDSLRVLQQMIGERLSMLEATQPFHLRPMIQENESGGAQAMARRQEAATKDKASETKTPNRRDKMAK